MRWWGTFHIQNIIIILSVKWDSDLHVAGWEYLVRLHSCSVCNRAGKGQDQHLCISSAFFVLQSVLLSFLPYVVRGTMGNSELLVLYFYLFVLWKKGKIYKLFTIVFMDKLKVKSALLLWWIKYKIFLCCSIFYPKSYFKQDKFNIISLLENGSSS